MKTQVELEKLLLTLEGTMRPYKRPYKRQFEDPYKRELEDTLYDTIISLKHILDFVLPAEVAHGD